MMFPKIKVFFRRVSGFSILRAWPAILDVSSSGTHSVTKCFCKVTLSLCRDVQLSKIKKNKKLRTIQEIHVQFKPEIVNKLYGSHLSHKKEILVEFHSDLVEEHNYFVVVIFLRSCLKNVHG